VADRDSALQSRNQNILGKSFFYIDLYNDPNLPWEASKSGAAMYMQAGRARLRQTLPIVARV
jgi:hypothetical protein